MCVRYFVYCVRRLYKGCRNGNTLFSTIWLRTMWWSHLKLWLIIHWLSVWGIGRLYAWQNYIGQSTEVHLICTFAPYWAKICRRSIWTIPSPRISCALSQQHTSVEIVIKPCRTFQVGLTTEDCLWYICTKLINNLYWINIKKTYVLIKNFLLMTLYSVCEQTKEPSRGCRCNLNLVPTLADRAEYIGLT